MKVLLKQKIIESIQDDPELVGKVAAVLGVSHTTIPRLLKGNHPKLTQKAVLLAIAKYLNLSEKDLLELVESKDKRVFEAG